jgi:hypothetical protein
MHNHLISYATSRQWKRHFATKTNMPTFAITLVLVVLTTFGSGSKGLVAG